MSVRFPLLDAAGRTVATYLPDRRLGRPCADMLDAAPGVPPDRVAVVALERLPGWVVAGADADLGAALVAAGALERRRVIVLQHDLDAVPGSHVPDDVVIARLTQTADDLLAAFLAAFPPGHVDRAPASSDAEERADLAAVLDGAEVGPLLAASRVALDASGTAVGAVTVNDRPGTPPLAGPWLSFVFRNPVASPPGTGAALVAGALAALREAGARSAGIAVTVGNPALGVYERLGFAEVDRGVTVIVPPVDGPPGR